MFEHLGVSQGGILSFLYMVGRVSLSELLSIVNLIFVLILKNKGCSNSERKLFASPTRGAFLQLCTVEVVSVLAFPARCPRLGGSAGFSVVRGRGAFTGSALQMSPVLSSLDASMLCFLQPPCFISTLMFKMSCSNSSGLVTKF